MGTTAAHQRGCGQAGDDTPPNLPGHTDHFGNTVPMADTTRTPGVGEPTPRRSFLQHPMGLYYLLIGATLALLGLGLLMVLSASSVLSIKLHGSAYTLAQRQLLFAVMVSPA